MKRTSLPLLRRRRFIALLGGVAAAARVHATLAYIVACRDPVLIFASPMSEPDINSVIERESGGLAKFSRLPRRRKTASAVGFRSQAFGRVA